MPDSRGYQLGPVAAAAAAPERGPAAARPARELLGMGARYYRLARSRGPGRIRRD